MATMDEKCLAPGDGGEQASLEGPNGERRRRAHEILSEQRSHLDRLENELAEQLQQLADEVADSVRLAESVSGAGESGALAGLQAQFEALKEKFGALDAENEAARRELEQAQLERGRFEQELRVRDALLKESQSHEEGRRVELATIRERLADAEAQLAAAREQHAALERKLADLREQADAEHEETKAQRRRIAREFKQQHTERIAEFDRRKAELSSLSEGHHGELEGQLAAAKAELLASRRAQDELRAAVASGAGESDVARREFETLRNEAAALRSQLEQAQAEHARAIDELRTAQPPAADPAEMAKLRQEHDRLREQLAASEAELRKRANSGEHASGERSDLQRRFEMAVEEVREMKRANAELESKLKARGGAVIPTVGGGLDWEAQKQRLLASLEAFTDDDEAAVAERASIEGTIRITDQVVAQKDEEIAELKRRLAQLGEDSAASSKSSAVAELLDHDEVIRQEREKLVQAQAEWREKIGKAEIDISVERAKIARDRAVLEEKTRQLQSDQDRQAANQENSDPSKPTRGRWLARLGLKDLDETK
jgi:DNA repair exonuclease SbcCD ATPase subunit